MNPTAPLQPGSVASDLQPFASYRGAHCLVTGGLGFIGSNLARALFGLGATVTVVDNRSPGQGANDFNLDGIQDRIEIRVHDIGDEAAIAAAVRDKAYVFNLAGKSSHIASIESPLIDMETNVRGQLVLLEAIRRENPAARVVFASTRSVYGAIQTNPVDESHPFLPTEVNSANKAAADLYHIAYWHAWGLRTVNLRLTNIYGPRMLMTHSRQGFINWFVRLAIDGAAIQLYGDGSQQRDLLYVDDAVEAFLLAGLDDKSNGVAFNVGSGKGVTLQEIADTLVGITGRGSVEYIPFPPEAKRIEIGNYVASTRRLQDALGWNARTNLQAGLASTCAYYAMHRPRYW